ncbi:acyl-CoA dehydrogenase family protein [Pseudomonas sp. TTU2014-080ASC]|uniref:acyl-CoA dehydrogenase family protein n=1 Tax=Pseudomonas sp. TTU2014-080ASC TaxID=1729724 RepID=UPI0007185612|nr:acyl-CoA dehydrogenase family protein [Pseudomonas sp. TTU2014-080ASC]KRW57447.1 acyl-CoA dehydrogenase [Pseudomonas sp. TTU2014-080ASC]
MNFTFTEDQLAFREAISRFLMTEAAPEMLREIWETDAGRSPDLRAKIAEQGLTALSVPEACGGLGMDDVAWALMTQELGYYAIPDSMADMAYVAAGLLSAMPASEQRDQWLGQIAEGSIRVAVGHSVNPLVADAKNADLLLLNHGDEIHGLSNSQVESVVNPSIDASRRLYEVQWQPSAQTLLASGEQGRALQALTMNRGALSTAGQLLGLAQRMLDLSVDYVAQRKQFGKPIGSFQAVKHHLADVATKIEFAKPVLYRAAYALAHGESQVDVRVSHAKLACCEAAWLAARHGIQVHGAMGYTWEVDLQMFMKRAWSLDSAWGDRGLHKNRIAHHVLTAEVGPGLTFGE